MEAYLAWKRINRILYFPQLLLGLEESQWAMIQGPLLSSQISSQNAAGKLPAPDPKSAGWDTLSGLAVQLALELNAESDATGKSLNGY